MKEKFVIEFKEEKYLFNFLEREINTFRIDLTQSHSTHFDDIFYDVISYRFESNTLYTLLKPDSLLVDLEENESFDDYILAYLNNGVAEGNIEHIEKLPF